MVSLGFCALVSFNELEQTCVNTINLPQTYVAYLLLILASDTLKF